MFTDLKPYPAYVDSGNQWFDSIPVSWETSRLRGVSRLFVSNVDKLTEEHERPVRLCNYVDVYKNEFITDRPGYMTASASDDEIRRFRVRVDDVAITKDSESWTDIGIPAYVAQEADDLVCGYHLGLLRTRKGKFSGAYLFRALQVPAIATQFHVAACGVTRYGLSQDDILSAIVPIPSLREQAAIVKYLGHANARIDRAIAVKRQLIALLEEQKQAIITQAVTRGLDPTVPLKDSGIPWLGRIPQHWNVRRAKYVFRDIDVRSKTGLEEQLSVSHLTGVSPRRMKTITMFKAASYVGHKTCLAGDLVVNTMWAWMGALGIARESGLVSPAYNVYRPLRTSGVNVEFVAVLFRTPTYIAYFRSHSTGLRPSRLRFYPDELLATPVVLPPRDEQAEIAAAIELLSRRKAVGVEKVLREIELLREFKARLTADVVTGQVDIRAAAARLPELDLSDLGSDVIGSDEDDLEAELAESLEEVDA